MLQIRVALNGPGREPLTDLVEWLQHQGTDAVPVRSAGQMGAPETVAIAVAAASALRGALTVIREWVRARRTEVEVSVDGGPSYRINSSTDTDKLLKLISSLRDNGHAAEDKTDNVNGDA